MDREFSPEERKALRQLLRDEQTRREIENQVRTDALSIELQQIYGLAPLQRPRETDPS